MKKEDFSCSKDFDNVYNMITFCKGRYDSTNSLLVANDGGTYTLYYLKKTQP